ncbi:hypothetical protein ACFSQD_02175 [Flavihumibacter stibioxidans]|uniref:Uncharacterized protein n=1 Tax=Flavihumibacter stibioxidans TaxID=1834163 RepID=A0ABR7MB77_9BACT|nr:hypothetical protein [Flavihumibacter stibioxidans]MBC6492290.1 hypothetical protein [Flavihumibacter stibioxidans]
MTKHNYLAILVLLLPGWGLQAEAQSTNRQPEQAKKPVLADSIAFHLYTDSLKKGVHNYINVDGIYPGGRWLPMTSKEIRFSSDGGQFEGNSLVLPQDFNREKVTITATYLPNPRLSITTTVYLKKLPDNEKLKTKEQVLEELSTPSGRKKKSRAGR